MDSLGKALGLPPLEEDDKKEAIVTIHADNSLCGESNPMYGRNHTRESRELMSIGHTGKTASPETRAKMSAIKKRAGNWIGDKNPSKSNPYWTGKTLSLEHRKKLSEAKKGMYSGEKNPMYGKSAMKGKKHSDATKLKMRNSRLAYLSGKKKTSHGE